MRTTTFFLLFASIYHPGYAQPGERLNDIKGYRLKPAKAVLIYYQTAAGGVDLANTRTLNNSVFFVPMNPAVEINDNGTNYSLIIIPGKQSPAIAPVQNRQRVSPIDFDQLLWIAKTNLVDLVPEYYKYRNDIVLGALTLPFKYRPALGDNASSLIDGSFNLGPYIGYKIRLSGNRPFFVSGIFSGGVTSLTYNSSNNTGITDKDKSESGFGVQYGGGVVFDLYKIQLGVILGGDHGIGDLSRTFKYQNNLWLAFSLSFSFLDNKANEDENKNK